MTAFSYSDVLAAYKKPLRVTVLTSGSGTFTPLVDWGLCTITCLGGGGGGGGGGVSATANTRTGGGGGGGMMVRRFINLPQQSYDYSVGAGGTGGAGSTTTTCNDGTSGGQTYLGPVIAEGGNYGLKGNTGSSLGGLGGGFAAISLGASPEWCVTAHDADVLPGGAGGEGGGSSGMRDGDMVGQPWNNTTITEGYPRSGLGSSGHGGGGGGTLYGKGGAGGGLATSGDAGTGYGSGGGGGGRAASGTGGSGGDGTGGLIIIEEWG